MHSLNDNDNRPRRASGQEKKGKDVRGLGDFSIARAAADGLLSLNSVGADVLQPGP